MILLPAIHVRGGRAVRLRRGRSDDETVYARPVEAATRWASEGAEWLHVVDLDAALGTGENHEAIAEVIASVDLRVQVGGGIRSLDEIRAVLDAGAVRVVIGTEAVADPEGFLRRAVETHGARIVVAVDVEGSEVRVRGWTESAGRLGEILPRLEEAGAPRFLVTQVARDGMLSGPDVGLYTRLSDRCGRPILAQGGVQTVDDLVALASTGVEGAVVGTALYEGTVSLPRAIEALRRGRS